MSPEWYGALLGTFLDVSFRAPVLAAIVALILIIARIRSNSVRHAAWTMVLLSMLLMPILPYLVPSFSVPVPIPAAVSQGKTRIQKRMPTATLVSSDVAAAPVRGVSQDSVLAPIPDGKPLWLFVAALFYCIGVFALFSRMLCGWRRMSRVVCKCTPIVLGTMMVAKLRCIPSLVCESEVVVTPLTAGILSPRIILPMCWRSWAPETLCSVLAHESSHVRRRDALIALLASVNRCLFWFHPLAWWLERKIAATAELACDDDAVRIVGGTKSYVQVLLDMAQAVHRRGSRLAWEGLGVNGNGFLRHRIDRLLRDEPFYEITPIRKGIVALGCAAAIFLVVACRQTSKSGAPQKIQKPAAESAQQRPSQSFWAKQIRILTNPVNAPFEFGDGTGVQGLDVDIGNQIAKNVGLKAKWVKAPYTGYRKGRLELIAEVLLGRHPGAVTINDYEYLFESLKTGKAEMLISSITIDPQKSADFEFSNPYYETGDIIAHQRNRVDITGLASLSGKKVGVAAGRPGDAFMERQKTATEVTLTKYFSLDDALGALNRREIDAVVGDEPLITYSSVKSFHNTTTVPVLINKYRYAVVVRKGKTGLLAKINQTIDRLESAGILRQFDQRWLGNVRRDRDLEVAILKNQNP